MYAMTLTVQTNLPYANVADVEVTQLDGRPAVTFAASAHGGPERLWFCFRVRNGKAMQKTRGPVRLLLKHVETMLGGNSPANIRPVIRYETGEWQRLEAGKPAPTRDGRMGAWWEIDAPNLYADIAVCFPYGNPELTELLGQTNGYYNVDAIGLSRFDRPILRLANDFGSADGDKRPGIYLTARLHAGETPGSWVLDGVLRKFAELGEQAPLVWAVPLTDPDGIEQGDYGKDAYPYDLNRGWGKAPMRHEVMLLQRDLWRWTERCDARLMLDFHAPGLCEPTGLYMYAPDPEQHGEDAWVDAFNEALGEYASPNFRRVINYPTRFAHPNSTQFVRETIGCAAITFECSYVSAGDIVLTPDRYREAGARIAQTIADRLA